LVQGPLSTLSEISNLEVAEIFNLRAQTDELINFKVSRRGEPGMMERVFRDGEVSQAVWHVTVILFARRAVPKISIISYRD
jgi:ribosomal protein L15